MRLASLNVQSGGIDGYNPDVLYPQRMDILKEVISGLDADTIGLIDTYRWVDLFGDEGLIDEFSELGYVDARCINMGGKNLEGDGEDKRGVAILSREPMTQVKIIDMCGKNALSAEVTCGEERLTFLSAYLDYYSEAARVRQTKALLESLDLTTPIVVAADLNAINRRPPEQQGVRQLGIRMLHAAARNLPKVNDFHRVVADMGKGDVLRIFEEAGLVDADPLQRPTLHIGNMGILALDHALYNPQYMEVTEFQVPRGKPYNKASDHFPIVFEAQPVTG